MYGNSVTCCPACGSRKITVSSGSYQVAGVIVRCNDCGKTFDVMETTEED